MNAPQPSRPPAALARALPGKRAHRAAGTDRGRVRRRHRRRGALAVSRRRSRFACVARDVTGRKQPAEQVWQRVETLTALYHGTRQLEQSLDSLKVAEEVARTCVEGFGLRLAWVGRAEPDGCVQLLAQYPAGIDYPRQIRVRWDGTPEGRGPAGRAIQTRAPVVANDLLKDLSVSPWREAMQRYGYRSSAAFPLVSRQRAFGALMLYSDLADAFTPERVQFFQGYARLTAAAMENARLYEETEARLSKVQALKRIDAAIASTLDLRMTLDIFLDQVLTQLKVNAACVLLYEPQTHQLSYAAGQGFRNDAIQQENVQLGESCAGHAALERRTIVGSLEQLSGGPRDDPRFLAFLAAEGFTAYAVTPLIAKGQVRGVLEVFHRAPLEPDDEWLVFLDMLAGQAAIAVDNATLFSGMQRANTELELAYDATLEGWSRALDLRDREAEGHNQHVAQLAARLARAMKLAEGEIVHVYRGALLHDIGKMAVPDAILHKPGPLTEEEWAEMRKHPQYAYDMLAPIQYLRPAIDIPYCHHEMWNGSGYPHGLRGEQIPLAARVYAVVDVWDALTSDRPYRKAWPEDRVRDHIRALAGTHFDPHVVETFIHLGTVAHQTDERLL